MNKYQDKEKLYQYSLKTLKPHLKEAVETIEKYYGKKIAQFILSVIVKEGQKISGSKLDPEEVIGLGFIVLKNCEETIKNSNLSKEEFENYSLKSLKNAFVKEKTNSYLLYEDYEDLTEKAFQIPDKAIKKENPYIYDDSKGASTEEFVEKIESDRNLIFLISLALNKLTPLEKWLIYQAYYLTEHGRFSFKALVQRYNLPYSTIMLIMKNSLEKIKSVLENQNSLY